MSKILRYILAFTAAIAICACGEDRTYELEEKTQHNKWMLQIMQDQYLWGDTLSGYEPEWKSFFAKPDDFLKTLMGKTGSKDKWSFVEIDTIVSDPHPRGHFNHVDSYGIDYELMTDPTGKTTKSYVRVMTVYPNSPASQSGLRRNDFISSFDGYKLSSKNITKLEKGLDKTLTVCNLSVDGEELNLVNERTLHLPSSRYVEDVAFPVHGILQVAGIHVGYLMCTRLVPFASENTSGHESGTEYQRRLDEIMAEMKSADVSEIVLDLRLCNYGTLSMAQRLASYVVNPTCRSGIFATTRWNQRYSANNQSLPYDLSVANLNMGRVFVLVSKHTQGAAEWLIHCLRSAMGTENVTVIGQPTAGQNVMTREIGYDYGVHVNAAVAFVGDGNGNSDYASIVPDVAVDEMTYAELSEYGDIYEPMLNAALVKICE